MLTKSKVMAWRQCPKRLWLESAGVPGAPADPVSLARGQAVGEAARRVFGGPSSVTLDRTSLTPSEALARTTELMQAPRILFEAAFGGGGLIAYADAVRPAGDAWDLLEVKASTSVKPHHVDDAALQALAVRRAGAPVRRVLIAHVESSWVYPGGEDLRGLFNEVDVTREVEALTAAAEEWVSAAAETLAGAEPPRETGRHCEDPDPCPYRDRCRAAEPQPLRPLAWLPGRLSKGAAAARDGGARSMDEVSDGLLNDLQRRVKTQTLVGEAYFDIEGAAQDLQVCAAPLHFLDFETVNPAVPLWSGTRPYQQVPFQFSLHVLEADGRLTHADFLMASGEDPSRAFAEALVAASGLAGAVIVYNAPFERGRIQELADRFEDMASALRAIADRLFDLQPVARARYYHPDQHGSWSIKKVLPCLVPELSYEDLEGVQNGQMAIEAYLELMSPTCAGPRRDALEHQLKRYCRLDTLAMVGLWARFTGADQLLEQVLALRE